MHKGYKYGNLCSQLFSLKGNNNRQLDKYPEGRLWRSKTMGLLCTWQKRLHCAWALSKFAGVAARRRLSTSSMEHVPVAIVGAGPTGLTLSTLLSQLGVPSVVLERRSRVSHHPQAHFINNRTMEVFRHMGAACHAGTLAQQVEWLSPPLDQWRSFVYCQHMGGQVYGEVDHFKGARSTRVPSVSPVGVSHLSQHVLLPLMLEVATGSGSLSDIRMAQEVTSIGQLADCVIMTVASQEGRSYSLSSRFLVAADGAHSRVRELCGVAMAGDPALQHLINIHFHSTDLSRRLSSRPAMLYFVLNSSVVMVLVVHRMDKGEFVAQVPYFPPVQSVHDFSDEVCRRLVAAAAGVPGLQVQVQSVRSWTMSAQVARKFQVGHVFLAGDAAHRFPPAGGFGMNTGIQDAHNLAWKLAAVLDAAAGEKLLGSYHDERHPVAVANTHLSVRNFQEAVRVPAAIGLNHTAADVLQKTAGWVSGVMPQGLSKPLLEGVLALGRLQAGAKGPLRSVREAALSRIFQSGETLRLQFPREDLGFAYRQRGAICPEAVAQPIGDTSLGGRDAPYVPTTAAGSRLPHAEIMLVDGGASEEVARVASTLDLFPYTHCHLTLLLGWSSATPYWMEAAAHLGSHTPVHVVVIFPPLHPMPSPPHSSKPPETAIPVSSGTHPMPSPPAFNGPQATAHVKHMAATLGLRLTLARDQVGAWRAVREVGEQGAILVRPDGHVGWRSVDGTSSSSVATDVLRSAAQRILFLHPGLFCCSAQT